MQGGLSNLSHQSITPSACRSLTVCINVSWADGQTMMMKKSSLIWKEPEQAFHLQKSSFSPLRRIWRFMLPFPHGLDASENITDSLMNVR